MTFDALSRQLLRRIQVAVRASLRAQYGWEPPDWRTDDRLAAIHLGRARQGLAVLVKRLGLRGPRAVACMLFDAKRQSLSEDACGRLGTCAPCGGGLDRGQSFAIGERGNAIDVHCLDCAHERKYREYEETGILSTSLISQAVLDVDLLDRGDHEINSNSRIRPRVAATAAKYEVAARRFMAEHDELARVIRCLLGERIVEAAAKTSDDGPVSGRFGGTKVLALATAGRVLATLSDREGWWVSTICNDDVKLPTHVGIQGLCTPFLAGLALVREAAEKWDSSALVRDGGVRIAGF